MALLESLLATAPEAGAPPVAMEHDPQQPVGADDRSLIEVPETELAQISSDIQRILEVYTEVMRVRWDREEKIENAYAMQPDRKSGIGDYPGAARLCSEMLMVSTDQATARIGGSILSTRPTAKVEPLDDYLARNPDAQTPIQQLASAVERFFDTYLQREIRIEDKLPYISLRFCKVGTAVVYAPWETKIKSVVRPSLAHGGRLQAIGIPRAGVDWVLIGNRDVMVWPAWIHDWQMAEWVGHRTWMSHEAFKVWAKKVKLAPEVAEKIINSSVAPAQADMKAATASGLKLEGTTNDKLTGLVPIWQLYGRRQVGGSPVPVPIKLFYAQEPREVLRVQYNENYNGKYDYFPIRYKKVDQSAWGNGVGHESLQSHLADTAFRNIGIDNLMASAFSLVVTKAGSTADTLLDRPYPGMRISSEDPDGDIAIKSFAEDGPIEMIYRAMEENRARNAEATGVSAVLSGQGDPTMKSGAGTGSTIALIEEGTKKFGYIDDGVRQDLSPLFSHTLDLVAQYGTEHLFSRYASPEDMPFLMALKKLQPGESVQDLLSFKVEAPNATNNAAMQKQQATVIWNFVLQQSEVSIKLAQQIFPRMNPAALVPYLVSWSSALRAIGQKVIDLEELPGMREILPKIPMEMSPEHQMVNTLLQQLQDTQMQLEQALAAGAGAPAPGGGGEEGVSSAPAPAANS